MLELAFAIALPALGSAVLFNIGSSSGGTDIIAMILKKYTSIDIGKALLATDFLIALAGLLRLWHRDRTLLLPGTCRPLFHGGRIYRESEPVQIL